METKPSKSLRVAKDAVEAQKKNLALAYDLLGISADAAQLGRALIRGERKRAVQNLKSIVTKFDKVAKQL